MTQILKSKNLATKFQILVEIAANQPTVHQKSIAAKLNVTPQAISEYVMKMEREGWVTSQGRSKYQVTREGINWVLSMIRELDSYSDYVRRMITNVTVCAAVAHDNLVQGQSVGLVMKDGLLFATEDVGEGAKGIAVSEAKEGEDIGVSNVEGIVKLTKGKITILKTPDIQSGGSAGVDYALLKKELATQTTIGAIGIEAMVALQRTDITPQYTCGVAEAAIEAVNVGLSFLIVCSEDAIPDLIGRLRKESLDYRFIDLSSPK